MPPSLPEVLSHGGGAEFPRRLGSVVLLRRMSRDERGETFVGARAGGVEYQCLAYVPAESRLARLSVFDDLKSEAAWLVRRVHGNLVQIFDVGEADGQVYFANELVEGRNLRAVRLQAAENGRPVDASLWIHVAIEVASAIEFVRAQEEKETGVAPNFAGLSPSSVLLGVDGAVKLSHLGACLALPKAALVDPDALALVPPEWQRGAPWSDRGDVFAVATLLRQCLTAAPGNGAGPAIDQELASLLQTALDPDPERRPADVATLRAALASFNKDHAAADGLLGVRTLVTDLFGDELRMDAARLVGLLARFENVARGGAGRTLTTFQPAGRPAPIYTDDVMPLGQTIPRTRYKVLSKLGEGGMGTVYEAEHVEIERRVALKLLHAELLRNPAVLQQFRQEARALSRIGNPYICDVTDWGEVPDGRVFFVMEYVDGISLGAALRAARRLPIARAIPILRQVAKALAAVHDKGIVHLDLKPDNVLLHKRDGQADSVKVVDFGIAGLLGQSDPTSKLMGTPEYMAPERIAGQATDHSFDIYALGILAYEMLAGEAPFVAATPADVLRMHMEEAPTPFSERLVEPVPVEVEAVIFQMLDKDPLRRPRTMQEVEVALIEAQIAARVRTAWDERLPLPPMDAMREDEIRRGFRRISTSLWRQTNVVLASVAALVAIVASMVLLREPTPTGARRAAPRPTRPRIVAVSDPAPPLVPAPVDQSSRSASGLDAGVVPIHVVATLSRPARSTPRAHTAVARIVEPPHEPGRDAPSEKAPASSDDSVTVTEGPRSRLNAEALRQVAESVERGAAALQAGRITQAEREFKAALAADPDHGPAIGGLAEVAFEDSRYEEAAAFARRALKLDPKRTRLAVILGDAVYKLGRFDEALVVYQKALALDPADPVLHARIARAKARVK